MANNFLLISTFILTTCFLVVSSFAWKSDCPASCSQPMDVGPCFGKILQWYFNPTSAKCERFYYGGCKGNSNRFTSRQTCNDKCSSCKEESNSSNSGNEHAKCDCNYERAKSSKSNKIGGCRISVPAPEGWKCQCTHKAWRWGCSGTAQKCRDGESCPENCTSRNCCKNGGGDCGGYDSGNLRQNDIPNCVESGLICGLGTPCCQGRCLSLGYSDISICELY